MRSFSSEYGDKRGENLRGFSVRSHALRQGDQCVRLQWFPQNIYSGTKDRMAAILREVTGNHYHGNFGPSSLNVSDDIESVNLGQSQISDDKLDLVMMLL